MLHGSEEECGWHRERSWPHCVRRWSTGAAAVSVPAKFPFLCKSPINIYWMTTYSVTACFLVLMKMLSVQDHQYMVKLWAEILSGNRIFLFYDSGVLQYSYHYYCFIIEEYPSNTEMKFQPTFFVCANIRIKLTFYFCHHHHRDHLLVFASYWHSGDFSLTSFILTIEDFFFLRQVAVWFPLPLFWEVWPGWP